MTYFFETYGCQMNKAESAALEQILIERGWSAAEHAETADLVVINTCSVRATAETRIHGRLGWYSALKRERKGEKPKGYQRVARPVEVPVKPLTLVVAGCMAERLKDGLKRDFPVVDYVVGPFKKQHFCDIVSAVEQNLKEIEETGIMIDGKVSRALLINILLKLKKNPFMRLRRFPTKKALFRHSCRLCTAATISVLTASCLMCAAAKFRVLQQK